HRVAGGAARAGVRLEEATIRPDRIRRARRGVAALPDLAAAGAGIDGRRARGRIDGAVAAVAVQVFLPAGRDGRRAGEDAWRSIVLAATEDVARVERRPAIELDGAEVGVEIGPAHADRGGAQRLVPLPDSAAVPRIDVVRA